MFNVPTRIQALEEKVADLQTTVALLLGHERLEVSQVPAVVIPAKTVLVRKKL